MSDLINVFVFFCCGILVRTNKSAIVQEKHCSRAAVEMANDGVVGLVYDARMCAHQNESNSEHPERPERISSIYQCLKSAGIVARFLLPPPISMAQNSIHYYWRDMIIFNAAQSFTKDLAKLCKLLYSTKGCWDCFGTYVAASGAGSEELLDTFAISTNF